MRVLTFPIEFRVAWPHAWIDALGLSGTPHGRVLVVAEGREAVPPILVARGVPEPRAQAWARDLRAETRPYSLVPALMVRAGILDLTDHAVYAWQAASPGTPLWRVDPGPHFKRSAVFTDDLLRPLPS